MAGETGGLEDLTGGFIVSEERVELHKSSMYIYVNLWYGHCPMFYREPWTWKHVETITASQVGCVIQ